MPFGESRMGGVKPLSGRVRGSLSPGNVSVSMISLWMLRVSHLGLKDARQVWEAMMTKADLALCR